MVDLRLESALLIESVSILPIGFGEFTLRFNEYLGLILARLVLNGPSEHSQEPENLNDFHDSGVAAALIQLLVLVKVPSILKDRLNSLKELLLLDISSLVNYFDNNSK